MKAYTVKIKTSAGTHRVTVIASTSISAGLMALDAIGSTGPVSVFVAPKGA